MERHRAEAEADLVAATGGASLCRTDGSPDAKRAEGALAAIAQLHRGARGAPLVDPTGIARDLLDAWVVDRSTAETMSRDWRDYRDGGIAVLRSVLADLGDNS